MWSTMTKSVRDSLAFLLESAGYTVRSYASAEALLQAVPDRAVGCVLTDVQMPELNGLELQRRMSGLGMRLPVIVMTGHGDVPIAVEAMKAGATDFLEKPFEDDPVAGGGQQRHRRQPAHARRRQARWPISRRDSPP